MKDLLADIKEAVTLIVFVLGAFRSTPEGRKIKAANKLMRLQMKHRKRRLKYAKGLRKDGYTREEINAFLEDYDRDYPAPT